MKSASSLLSLLATTLVLADEPEAIRCLTLDERVVVTVPVATNRVTTISFPGPITAIDAVGVSTDLQMPGLFQLGHTKGSAFLSVRALARKAATNLNIRWNKRTYVFELVESEVPLLALNLEHRPGALSAPPAPLVNPTRLLALLDKAKAFALLKQQHPDAVAQVEARTFADQPLITDFGDYEIRIEEMFRFNAEDTVVFHLTLRNKSDQEIRYRPDSFSIRVGNRLYHQAISDAPGVLPPKASSTVYLAITGTPDGGRNELSLKNEFSVLVARLSPPPVRPDLPAAAVAPAQTPQSEPQP